VAPVSTRRAERGSAVVEFVALAVLVLVPLVYLVMTVARVQAGAYAVSTAAREAGRAYVTSPSAGAAPGRASAAARLAFEDQGFGGLGAVEVRCDGSPCLRPGARIETVATVRVPLPLVPAFARGAVPLEVPLESGHLSVVDRFRAAP
jgi:hypothetical protein